MLRKELIMGSIVTALLFVSFQSCKTILMKPKCFKTLFFMNVPTHSHIVWSMLKRVGIYQEIKQNKYRKHSIHTISTHTHIYAHTHTCICTYTHIYIYIHTYTCTHIIYIYAYKHVHIIISICDLNLYKNTHICVLPQECQ